MIYKNNTEQAVMALENQRLAEEIPSPCHKCESCGEGIYQGEEFLNSQNGTFCFDCVTYNLNTKDLMEIMGYEFEEAGE